MEPARSIANLEGRGMSNDVNSELNEEPKPESDQDKPLKEELREGAAKVFGLAVEVGSILGGTSGEIVSAEREVAEAEAEEFIDRIDGEG